MQGADCIFCLTDENYNFWRYNASTGVASKTAQPYFLDFAPVGLDGLGIQNVRNRKYWGIDRAVTAKLEYVKDGSQILKHCFYNLGQEEKVYLGIASQRLEYRTAPLGAIAITTGGNPFVDGDNTGTITGPEGATIFLKLQIAGAAGDTLTGFVGPYAVSVAHGDAALAVQVIIPPAGFVTYTLLKTNVSTTAVASMQVVNEIGDTRGGYGYFYKHIFRAPVDFKTFLHDGPKVAVTTLEDGLAKFLKANEGATYELAMNVPEAIYVAMDGVKLKTEKRYFVGNGSFPDVNDYLRNHLVELQDLGTGDVGDQISFMSVPRTRFTGTVDALAGNLYNFFYASTDTTLELEWNIKVGATAYGTLSPGSSQIRFQVIRNGLHVPALDVVVFSGLLPGIGVGQLLTGTGSIALEFGDEVYFRTYYTVIGSTGDEVIEYKYLDIPDSYVKGTAFYKHPTTYVRCLRAQYVFDKLAELVTEGSIPAAASAYLALHADKVFTSGTALRGFADPILKISWNVFFQHYDCFDSVGILETAGAVDMARREDMLDTTNVIELGEPAAGSFKVGMDGTLGFNQLRIGYQEPATEVGALNGAQDPNCEFLFSMGAISTVATLEKIDPVRVSCYEIEKVRIDTANRDTTNFKNDNDVFALHIEDTLQPEDGDIPAHYLLDRTLNATATGMLETESIFNLEFTPKRNMLRMGSWLHSLLWKCDQLTLGFLTATQNSALASGLPLVTEKAPVQIADLDAPFFVPLLLKGDWKAPEDLEELLELNILRAASFTVEGETYKGLIMKMSSSPANQKIQQYEFLSLPSNNHLKLIDYAG